MTSSAQASLIPSNPVHIDLGKVLDSTPLLPALQHSLHDPQILQRFFGTHPPIPLPTTQHHLRERSHLMLDTKYEIPLESMSRISFYQRHIFIMLDFNGGASDGHATPIRNDFKGEGGGEFGAEGEAEGPGVPV